MHIKTQCISMHASRYPNTASHSFKALHWTLRFCHFYTKCMACTQNITTSSLGKESRGQTSYIYDVTAQINVSRTLRTNAHAPTWQTLVYIFLAHTIPDASAETRPRFRETSHPYLSCPQSARFWTCQHPSSSVICVLVLYFDARAAGSKAEVCNNTSAHAHWLTRSAANRTEGDTTRHAPFH